MIAERIARVLECFDGLTPKEQKVLSLHYHLGLNLSQIAVVFGVGRGRISQIHVRAIHKLRVRCAGMK